jgi:hypothetical protein
LQITTLRTDTGSSLWRLGTNVANNPLQTLQGIKNIGVLTRKGWVAIGSSYTKGATIV